MGSCFAESWCEIRHPKRWYEHPLGPSLCQHFLGGTFKSRNISFHLVREIIVYLQRNLVATNAERTGRAEGLDYYCNNVIVTLGCSHAAATVLLPSILPSNFEILEAKFSFLTPK